MDRGCLVIGAAMLDIIMEIDRLPVSGEDVYARTQSMTVGGCAYNVADILKHFQTDYTLFAPVGTGMYAAFIETQLHRSGNESPSDNGYCLCLVEADGERTFLTLPGIECRFEKEWFARLDAGRYDAVYVSGYELEGEGGEVILDFLEKHQEYTVYYAPGPRITYIAEDKRNRMTALSPVLHLNEREALASTGKSKYGSGNARRAGCISVGKRGRKGCPVGKGRGRRHHRSRGFPHRGGDCRAPDGKGLGRGRPHGKPGVRDGSQCERTDFNCGRV